MRELEAEPCGFADKRLAGPLETGGGADHRERVAIGGPTKLNGGIDLCIAEERRR